MSDNQLPSGHRNLKLDPGQVAICANYGLNRGMCKNPNCTYLHVCRAWLAGYCQLDSDTCPYKHALVSDVFNRNILVKRLGEAQVGDCDENMRRQVKKCFAVLCTSYVYSKNGFCVSKSKSGRVCGFYA